MNNYLVEIFEWITYSNNIKCFHLVDSKILKSSKNIKEDTYYKDNKLIIVSKYTDNEIKISRTSRKSSRSNSKNSIR